MSRTDSPAVPRWSISRAAVAMRYSRRSWPSPSRRTAGFLGDIALKRDDDSGGAERGGVPEQHEPAGPLLEQLRRRGHRGLVEGHDQAGDACDDDQRARGKQEPRAADGGEFAALAVDHGQHGWFSLASGGDADADADKERRPRSLSGGPVRSALPSVSGTLTPECCSFHRARAAALRSGVLRPLGPRKPASFPVGTVMTVPVRRSPGRTSSSGPGPRSPPSVLPTPGPSHTAA